MVTSAAVDDGVAAPQLLERADSAVLPRIQEIWGDTKYHNHNLYQWLQDFRPGWELEVISRPPGTKGFTRLPKRWVVERTHAWLWRYRRHSKDYERRTDSSEAMIRISSLNLMLRRLAPSAKVQVFHYRPAA
jgi:putative transposase